MGFVFIFVFPFDFRPLRFEDFDIDQFVDYLQNDDEIASNNHQPHESTPSPNHQTGYANNFEPATQSTSTEKFFYTCTVCRDILGSSHELLRHVRTHTRLKAFRGEEGFKVIHRDRLFNMRP